MAEAALLVFFPFLMAFAASSDLFTMTIPNRVAVILVLGFVIVAHAAGLSWHAIGLHAAAGGSVLAATFAMFAFGWIGGGDAKLAAAVALWLGFDILADYLLTSAVAGGVLTLALLAMRQWPLPAFTHRWDWLTRLHDEKKGVPYGIALAGAALALYPSSDIWTATLAG